jgi:hypothetical protein
MTDSINVVHGTDHLIYQDYDEKNNSDSIIPLMVYSDDTIISEEIANQLDNNYYNCLPSYSAISITYVQEYAGPWKRVQEKKRMRRSERCNIDEVCEDVACMDDEHQYNNEYVKAAYALRRLRDKNKVRVRTTGYYSDKKKTTNHKYVCHGASGNNTVEALVQESVNEFITKSVNIVENIVILVNALSTSTNTINALAIISLYMKTHMSGSITDNVLDICREYLVGTEKVVQSESLFDNIGKAIKMASVNWKTFQMSPLFTHVLQVVSLAISIGYFPRIMAHGKFSIKGLSFLASKLKDIQCNSMSFYEALVESIIFFLTKGYLCFSEGTLSHFFYSNKEIADSDTLYTKLIAAEQLIVAGKLNLLKEQGIDNVTCEAEYNVAILDLIKRYETLHKTTDDNYLKSILNIKILKLRTVFFSLRKAQTNIRMRRRPFCLMISGASSIGKSTLNSMLITTILQAIICR